MTQQTIEQLQREMAQMRADQAARERAQADNEARARFGNMPPAERSIAEREYAVNLRERDLNEAAFLIRKTELRQKYYIPEAELAGITDANELDMKAHQFVMSMPPERMRQVAAINEALLGGNLPDPATVAAATGAAPPAPPAGAAAPPAGVGAGGGGGAAPLGVDPTEAITEKYRDKGAAAGLAGWLEDLHNDPATQSQVLFGRGGGAPAPASPEIVAPAGAASPASNVPGPVLA